MRTREKKEKICKNCGKKIPNRNVYCNNSCQAQYQTQPLLENWIKGINLERKNISRWMRNYLIEEANNKCSKCGWGEINPHTNKISLEVDHIDGDAFNNKKNNLRVLCPNCHSLTKTYKNTGSRQSVRNYRKKYYKPQ